MSGIGNKGFLSTSDIMAWVGEHMGKMGEEIRHSMTEADDRTQLMQDLGALKAELGTYGNGGFQAKADAISKFLADHKGCEGYDDLKKILEPMKDQMSNAQTLWDNNNGDHKDLQSPDQSLVLEQLQTTLGNIMPSQLSQLDAQLNGLNKEDALAMLKLQQATTKLNEGMSQASNVLSTLHSDAMTAINNIRA